MLSIQAMTGGQGAYYLDLAREDYYLDGGEPPGLWWGRGAQALRLHGRVERNELERMLDGFSVDGEKLTQNAGHDKRRPGWDLTFSAPKSVSVLWSQADSKTRFAIQEAHLSAVKTALDYLENEASFSRRGKGGHASDRVGLSVALFEHGTSRAADPQLHTHCLVMNVGVRPDGSAGTLISRSFYQHKMTAGAMYRTQLAHHLRNDLGLECERKRTWFELAGVPHHLCEYFSQRRQQITKKLGELGVETASAAAFATLATREVKTIVPARSELFDRWQGHGCPHEFRGTDWRALVSPRPEVDRAKVYAEVLGEALRVVTREQSHFGEKDLLRRTLEAAQGRGLDAAFVQGWLKHDLSNSERIVRLGERDGEQRYTTGEILKQERRLFELADSLAERNNPVSRVRLGYDKRGLKQEQINAVSHLTEKTKSIALLAGMAGTGKTTTLKTCRERWEAEKYQVLGTALAGKAARELQSGAGIQSCTLETLFLRMNPTTSYQLKHHAKQLWRALQDKPTYKLKPLKIDRNTVLVVDEAGMIGSQQMARLLEAVHKHGGKVVLVGDSKQLQPIDAGAPFAALSHRLGCAELTDIARQKDAKDRQVVREMANGQAGSALKSLEERGRLEVHDTSSRAKSELVTAWSRESGFEPAKTMIFCSTNEEARELNARCQAQQSLRRRIDTTRSLAIHDARAYVGDRVLFTQNNNKIGVSNGETGTVVKIDRFQPRMTVRTDRGDLVQLMPKQYTRRDREHGGECALRLGYAVTTHKGQGSTVDFAYVLAGGSMQDREISYVQLSRAKLGTRVYTDRLTAGDNLAGLTKSMERSRAKDMAHDVMREDREHRLRLTLQQPRAATA